MKNAAAAAEKLLAPPPPPSPSFLTSSSSLLLLLLLASASRPGGLTNYVGCSGLVVHAPPSDLRGVGFRHASPSLSPPCHLRRDGISLTMTRTRRRRRGGGDLEMRSYLGVNDYFASFDNNNKNDDDDGDGDNAENNNGKKNRKYVGHGRLSLGRDESYVEGASSSSSSSSEGGLFDVNNYFSSFGNNFVDNDDDDNEDGDLKQQQREREQKRQPPPPRTPTTRRKMTYEEIVAYNNARLCPKLLLTQRAIQSFIYLLEECRDPHSGKWIEDFLGTRNLGNYHGTGAINVTRHPTWDSVMYDMMGQPNTKMIVSAKRRGRGHGGWSKNNPYLEERYVEFGIDIRPASLVQRLLAVRGQLASEFERDLEIVRMVDATAVMDSYFHKLAAAVAEDRDDDATTSVDGRPRSSLFDRVSVDILANFTEYQDGGGDPGSSLSSSPFRRGNFDLLYSLCTQAAAHRLLRELQQSASSSTTTTKNNYVNDDVIAFQWFKRFYVDNAPLYFDGDQNFGRADDFIDALLRTSPTLVGGGDGDANAIVGLTDPLRVAERIVAIRGDISSEWRGMMGEVTEDHRMMNEVLFRVMMGRAMDESGNVDDVVDIREETTFEELADDTGAFD
ncbi:hypothetical protein ACHAW5_009278 [Stephanodiscus triporus]|uniref:Uncharacterized protein n=1 Tax=Stephanodiscus triporus TaxID=2934178 RepID=A0ABD3N4D7_9STRA